MHLPTVAQASCLPVPLVAQASRSDRSAGIPAYIRAALTDSTPLRVILSLLAVSLSNGRADGWCSIHSLALGPQNRCCSLAGWKPALRVRHRLFAARGPIALRAPTSPGPTHESAVRFRDPAGPSDRPVPSSAREHRALRVPPSPGPTHELRRTFPWSGRTIGSPGPVIRPRAPRARTPRAHPDADCVRPPAARRSARPGNDGGSLRSPPPRRTGTSRRR